VNSVLVVGRVSKAGPKLTYAGSGTPTCSLVVEVDELGKGGEVFTTWIGAEISGKFAEATAAEVEPGDEVMLSGKLKYKSVVDAKTGVKMSKLIISSWGIQQRRSGPSTLPQDETSMSGEGDSTSTEHETRPESQPRRRGYPKQALQGGFAPHPN
jgi:single-stranded DNA-binding protein